jgi:hypothetical protein
LDDRAGNRLQRIARFGAECSRAFEANETEEREHQAEAQSAAGHAVEMELFLYPGASRGAPATSSDHDTITVTDAASIQSMRRAEILTSR